MHLAPDVRVSCGEDVKEAAFPWPRFICHGGGALSPSDDAYAGSDGPYCHSDGVLGNTQAAAALGAATIIGVVTIFVTGRRYDAKDSGAEPASVAPKPSPK